MAKIEKDVDIISLEYQYIESKRKDIALIKCWVELDNKDMLERNILNQMESGQERVVLTLETKKPILDKKEKEYLSSVIRPFRDQVKYIRKIEWLRDNREYISVGFKNYPMLFPLFENGKMYKGMELDREYSLEELGL